MKLRTAIPAIVLLFAFRSVLLAQTGSTGGGLTTSGTGTTSSGRATTAQDPNTGSPEAKRAFEEANTDDKDDSLYHGKTDSTDNPMMRDEGPLHLKTRKKEKVQEVDSLNSLHRGATDKNFEGSLLHSSVTSIDDIVPTKEPAAGEAKSADPRFTKKELTYVRKKSDGQAEAQKDSSPSPTPTATASARTTDKKN